MGTKLEHAKKAGTCPKCGNTWNIGESIFWDRNVKNTAGGNVTCSDESCFNVQGGKITPFIKSTPQSGFSGGFKKEFLDLTFLLPVKEEDTHLDSAARKVKQAIARADFLASELYPNLKKTSDTYGQIRSKLADQILGVFSHAK